MSITPINPDINDPIIIYTATGDFLSPNVATTPRTAFTAFFLRFTPAPDADPVYRHLFFTHQRLAKLLIDHPAMEPNRAQTFSTPANSKNKVYFTWDFILRTFQFLAAKVNPRNPRSGEMFKDVVGRSVLIKELILDTTGKLEAGNRSVGYNDDEGVEFTEEIKNEARKLDRDFSEASERS